jgi:hypothetical protein
MMEGDGSTDWRLQGAASSGGDGGNAVGGRLHGVAAAGAGAGSTDRARHRTAATEGTGPTRGRTPLLLVASPSALTVV